MIDRELWLKALGESDAAEIDPDALTAGEFAGLLDCAESTARTKLKRLVREQKAERTHKWVQTSDGRRLRVPAFRLVQDTP